jgi:acetyl-CoA carboxylase carboxyl transferase subunit beta
VNWITDSLPPRIKSLFATKRDTPENLWIKCPETGEMVFHRDLEANLWVVPSSGYHMRMPAKKRLETLFDGGAYETIALPTVTVDPLKFRDEKRYVDRLKDAKTKTGAEDAIHAGLGKLDGRVTVAAVQDFEFMGGSLGMAAGEGLVASMMTAVHKKAPYILFASSGGARMQEGILSLMQMPRTTVAVQALREERLPYIVVLTNPTTGGVTASYAMLGDVHIAEPGALIGFAGKRVIEETIREKLPEGFQSAEYLREHGMVDMVVPRKDLQATLARILTLLMQPKPVATVIPLPVERAAPPPGAPVTLPATTG